MRRRLSWLVLAAWVPVAALSALRLPGAATQSPIACMSAPVDAAPRAQTSPLPQQRCGEGDNPALTAEAWLTEC